VRKARAPHPALRATLSPLRGARGSRGPQRSDKLSGVNITRDEARRIAALSHLQFDDDALDRMAADMTKILSYIDQLREVEIEHRQDCLSSNTPLREDVVRPGVDRDAVERNAPAWRDGHFVVPKVIE